jgi:NitT/TauT family transport system ATP-binding protein
MTLPAKPEARAAARINVTRLHPAPFISFENVGKTFVTKTGDRVEAIRDVSFSVPKNEFITIVGPSGCGKSTLLRMLAGLLPPTIGRVLIDNHSVKEPVADVGMVFQRPALLPWRNVLGNVLLPAIILGMDSTTAMERAHALLGLVGLQDFVKKYPNELSGGMQQRVAICRALMCRPMLLLMDEPFAALDAMTREDLSIELMRIWQHETKTVLFITHSITEAVLLADRIVVISSRPGTVMQTINVNIPRPRDIATTECAEFQTYAGTVRAAIGGARGGACRV